MDPSSFTDLSKKLRLMEPSGLLQPRGVGGGDALTQSGQIPNLSVSGGSQGSDFKSSPGDFSQPAGQVETLPHMKTEYFKSSWPHPLSTQSYVFDFTRFLLSFQGSLTPANDLQEKVTKVREPWNKYIQEFPSTSTWKQRHV